MVIMAFMGQNLYHVIWQ